MIAAKVIAAVSCGFSLLGTAQAQEHWSVGQAVSVALANRGSIKSQQEKVLAAEAAERAVAVEPPMRAEFGYGSRPELGIGNDLLLALPIDLFGKNAAERSVAHAELLSARSELNQQAVELQSEVFTSYAELQLAQEELKSATTLVNLAQRSYDATKKRIDSGDLAPSQLLRSDLELRRANQNVSSDQLNLVAARATFAGVLGVAPSELPLLDSAPPALPGLASVETRPDVEVARAAVASAAAEKSVRRAAPAPDFEMQLAHDFWDSSGRYSARAQFVWNFFDYGSNTQHRSAASHSAKSAELALKDLIGQARAQVTAAQSSYRAAQTEFESYGQLAADAKTILDKEEKAFALGGTTLLDVFDAMRSFRDILDSQNQSRSRLVMSEGKYLAATGTLASPLPRINKK